MVSPFERLPVEVFDIIAFYLDLPSYSAIRLSSRQLHLLSFSTFIKRYYTELTTTLGSASLDRLVNISRHNYLSNVVAVLDIRLLNHRDYKLLTKISRVGIYPPPKRFEKVSSVRPEHISQEATLYDDVCKKEHSKCIVDRLTRALEGFSNLQTIRFRAHHVEPYGWRSTTMPDGDLLFRSKCFQAVVDAVLKSEVRLTEFGMAKGKKMIRLSKCANLPHPALQFPLPSLLGLQQHCFSNLESLTLSIISAYNGDARIPGWENGLSHLISTAPLIKHLTLSLDRNKHISHYSAAVVRSLALSCRVPELQTFQLVNSSLHEEHLAAFLATHAGSLSQLILSDIELLTGSWSSLWTSLIEVEGLRCLKLAYLGGSKAPVLFRRRNKDRHKITLDVASAERPMDAMLNDLITACNSEIDMPIDGVDAS